MPGEGRGAEGHGVRVDGAVRDFSAGVRARRERLAGGHGGRLSTMWWNVVQCLGVCRVGRSAGSCVLGGGEDSLGDAEWGWSQSVSTHLSVYFPRIWKLLCQDVLSH